MASNKEALTKIVGYYDYLFTFPTRGKLLAIIFIIALTLGFLSHVFAFGVQGASSGLFYGFVGIAIPIMLSDLFIERFFKDEVLITPRRLNIISFVWCLFACVLMIISGGIAGLYGVPQIFIKGTLLAILSALSLRALIFMVFPTGRISVTCSAIFIQPTVITIIFYIQNQQILSIESIKVLFSALILLSGPIILVWRLVKWKGIDTNLRMLPLFRGFILAWAEEVNEPLELELEKISTKQDLEVDMLTYRDENNNNLGILVNPYVHPGPFRKVGSSNLTITLSNYLNSANCPVLVTHGISNHETDMARSRDMNKITNAIEETSDSITAFTCTPIIKSEIKKAKASCQLFGNIALITLSLAPESYDDIPDSIKDQIRLAANKLGFIAITIDCHNSLDHIDLLTDEDTINLVEAAIDAMLRANKIPQNPFSAGFNKVKPIEWGPDEGMGEGGIGAVIINQENTKNTYLVFDSNNMIRGFIKRIQDALIGPDIVDCEILTSDTHIVNAIGASSRGYSPIGEKIDQNKVINYCKNTLAKITLSAASVSFRRVKVSGVSVLGSKGIIYLKEIIQKGFQLFATTAIITMPISFIAALVIIFS